MARVIELHNRYLREDYDRLFVPIPIKDVPPPILGNCTLLIGGTTEFNAMVMSIRVLPLEEITHYLASRVFPRIPIKVYIKKHQVWVAGHRPGKKADIIIDILSRRSLVNGSGNGVTMKMRIALVEFKRTSAIKMMQHSTALKADGSSLTITHNGETMTAKKNGNGKKAAAKKGNGKGKAKAKPKAKAATVKAVATAVVEKATAPVVEAPEAPAKKEAKPKRIPQYAGKKLAAFELDGNRVEIKSFKALMVGVSTQLLESADDKTKEKLLGIRGSRRPYFDTNGDNMIRGHQLAEDFWVETNLSADRIVELSHRAMDVFNLKPEALSLEYRAPPSEE